jgi:hypothetical protein
VIDRFPRAQQRWRHPSEPSVEGECKASYKGSERVREDFRGEPVWEGDVHKVRLSGHATANICYVWSAPVGETHNRRFFAVLKLGPVQSARDAVRASIVQTYREETGEK